MSVLFSYLIIPYILSMFLAMNMGGSGTAPAFSAAYGANLIRKDLIPGIFGVMVFIGAIIAGKGTATSIGQGLLNPSIFNLVMVSITLFSVAVALLLANLLGVPQSTSQATVLAVTAPAVYFSELNAEKLFYEIIPTWFILPMISFIMCFCIGKYIYKPLRRRGFTLSNKVNNSPLVKCLVILMSLYVAFSIGSNNVANAAGPIASMTINELGLGYTDKNFVLIMILATLIVAPNFGIGSSILGQKVLRNTGKEIVLFGKIEAMIISFVSASLLLTASLTRGIPTSLVQLNVAAIIGIGVAKLGFKNIFRKTEVNRFFVVWIVAPVLAFGLSLLLTYCADCLGYLMPAH